MIKTLSRRLAIILIIAVIVSAVMTYTGWSLVRTNTITIDITRYALEGNSTVISSFYALVYPGDHRIYVCIHSDTSALKVHVEIYILTRKGPVKILSTNSNTGCFSAEFRADNKIIYGFVVSKLEVLGALNNPYSRAIIAVKIS